MGPLIRSEVPEWISSGDGYGYGSSYGYGSGDGSGSGSGYGYGYGSGSGSGSGYGYGSGSGYGDGYGSGSVAGSGYGSGNGYGDYWASTITYFSERWPDVQKARLQELREIGATIAFWKSDASGRACNGGINDPVRPGTIETVKGPLEVCTQAALHATLMPPKWQGERWWVVALIGEVQGDHDKYGALTREILGEAA